MSALSIPASSGYGQISLVNQGVSAPQKQSTVPSITDSTQSSASSLPKFSSALIYIDPSSNQVVFETRDPETGKLTNQLPSSLQLRAYRIQQNLATPASSSVLAVQTVQSAAKPIAASGKTVLAA